MAKKKKAAPPKPKVRKTERGGKDGTWKSRM